MKFIIKHAPIPPDNAENVFHDYQQILMVFARDETKESEVFTIHTDKPAFLLFGCKESASYLVPIEEAKAKEIMAKAFMASMTKTTA